MALVYHPELDVTLETNDGYAEHLVESCGWVAVPDETSAVVPRRSKKATTVAATTEGEVA